MKFYTKIPDHLPGSLRKLLWIMRMIVCLLIAGVMQVNANAYGQKVNLERKNIAIKEIFKEIKNQTGYDVLWQPGQLNAEKKIDVKFKQVPLEKVIMVCVAGQDVEFTNDEHTIVIVKKNKTEIHSVQAPVDSVIYRGRIIDESGKPMAGATIRLKGSTKVTKTTSEGAFAIYGPKRGTLQISYLGYLNKEVTLNGLNPKQIIEISLIPGINTLGEVNVVSTGYQDLPKERATGSFEVVTKEQLLHSTNPNLLRRLEGITTSMDFNNQLTPNNSASNATNGYSSLSGVARRSPITNLTIRGKNTLNTVNNIDNQSGEVLIVIDGIATPYSIDQIDPNDVENITILKDAASASIWGSRAANGVIVIKTKKGSYQKPVSVSFNTNFNTTDKINLFYKPLMSTSDFIDAQIFQFNAANTAVPSQNVNVYTPRSSDVAEILFLQKQGKITAADATAQINALRGNDVRKDFEKYIERRAVAQNYSLGIDGGSKFVSYRLSGGYSNSVGNSIGSSQDRLSLMYNTSIRLLKNLEVQANITYSKARTQDQGQGFPITAEAVSAYFPYTRLVDDQGNPAVVPIKYSPVWLDLMEATYGSRILSLRYKPLDDINESSTKTNSQNVNMRLTANYKLNDIFSANVTYNYSTGYNQQELFNSQNSFYMRDLIDLYTAPPSLVRAIPLGALYQPAFIKTNNQTLRGQLNVNKTWNSKHALNAIAGIDASQTYSYLRNDAYYGYNPDTKIYNNNLNFLSNQNLLLYADPISGAGFGPIPGRNTSIGDTRLRNYSLFSNAAYTYNSRYTFSASVRKDVSSEFRFSTNKGGTPFYSFGGSWNIGNESFYKVSWLPQLQFRTTFGYNGNTNPSISGRAVLGYSTNADLNNKLFYANTVDASGVTNTSLRPEKTAVLNFGVDFGLRNNRLSGSIEYYDKKTSDLIAPGQLDPSTGFSVLPYNIGTLHGWGSDVTLNSQNLHLGLFSWNSNFLFSYNRVKVAKLYGNGAGSLTAGRAINNIQIYTEGADLSRLYAYRTAGLDPTTGDPRGYLNGQPVAISASNDVAITAINNSLVGDVAKLYGSAVPVYYGSLRNTFNYERLALSFNLLYKLGYYFRRPISQVVRYNQLLAQNAVQGAEYAQRWQKPGDELTTNVPSFTYPTNQNRDFFYYYSDINVLKADHVRLQEINLSYGFGKKSWFVKNPRVYASVSNLGVIWRANKLGLDPEANDYPNPRSYSLGLSANF